MPAAPGKRFTIRMKKILLLLLLLPLTAVAGFAQESRQDISVSGSALFPPYIAGNGSQLHATVGYGALISYRYLLTPHSGLEVNYQYAQEVQHFTTSTNNVLVHDREQEISGAYVRSFNFRNFNPFLEAGIGGFLLSPIDDQKTTFRAPPGIPMSADFTAEASHTNSAPASTFVSNTAASFTRPPPSVKPTSAPAAITTYTTP